MKTIIIVAAFVASCFTVNTAEAAIPVRKNLVEVVNTASANSQDVTINNQTEFNQSQENNSSSDASTPAQGMGNSKSWTTALILVILLGGIGVHRFYLGYTGIGIAQILTLGGLGIWSLIDLIRIALRDLQPKNGSYSD